MFCLVEGGVGEGLGFGSWPIQAFRIAILIDGFPNPVSCRLFRRFENLCVLAKLFCFLFERLLLALHV